MNIPALIPERRTRQRFPALRNGKPCLWLEFAAARWALNDLSLDGFSIPAEAPLNPGESFDFVLRLDDAFDKVRGKAQAMNEAGGMTGCRFLSFEGEGAERIFEWLTVIVICSAKLRITAKEAEAIVKGPSLI